MSEHENPGDEFAAGLGMVDWACVRCGRHVLDDGGVTEVCEAVSFTDVERAFGGGFRWGATETEDEGPCHFVHARGCGEPLTLEQEEFVREWLD